MSKKITGILTVLVVAIAILAFNNYHKKETLSKNAVSTFAIIENIATNTYDTDFSPAVENIHVTYTYMVNTKKITKTQEISRHEHDLYFSKTRNIGDSIYITYDSKKPTNSKIKKVIE